MNKKAVEQMKRNTLAKKALASASRAVAKRAAQLTPAQKGAITRKNNQLMMAVLKNPSKETFEAAGLPVKLTVPKPKPVVSNEANPKDAAGRAKVPLSLVPYVLTAETSLAYLEGKLKYGEVNWRATPVYASVYIDAAMRHLQRFAEGEDRDPLSRVHHLANAAACFGIILDAANYGTLIDDRKMSNGKAIDLADALAQTVAHLTALHQSKNPKHYLIGEGKNLDYDDKGHSLGREQALGTMVATAGGPNPEYDGL